jgi:hypothetical protein
MYKVGDKVKYIRYNEHHGISEINFNWPIGTIFTISEINVIVNDYNGSIEAVRLNEIGWYWYMPIDCIQLIDCIKRLPPKNDIEWLDRVQLNFKE